VTDTEVRLHIYERFLEVGRPPTVVEAAEALDMTAEDVEAAYRRLEDGRAIVLAPGTTNVWMANPLSAVPTPFRVEVDEGSWWGNCIWDAFGILSMLGTDGRVFTSCPDCQDPLVFSVEGGRLGAGDGVVHFAVPAARWWQNIGYT
jgi:hypothetical protein